jgi:outer membrane receptor protein involved in Fe transport
MKSFQNKPISLAILIALSTANVSAQEDIERIEVSGDLSSRTLDQLATSATVIGESLLAQKQARHLEDILIAAPNTNFASGASRGKFIQIRGIGERSQFAEPINPSVALVVDDIDFSGIGALGTLFDVQQVEVLSGPQSTASGASGLAGLVKIVSQQPTDTQEGTLELSVAEFNTTQIAGAYSNALTSNINARVALQQVKSDGFVENAFLGRSDTNNIDELSAKLAIDYLASESTVVKLRYYHFDIDNGYDAFSLDNDNITQSDEPGKDATSADALSLKLEHDLSFARLNLILSQTDSELDYGYDEDWTFVGFHPDGYSSTDRYFREVKTTSIDLRLNADNWVAGVYGKQTDEDLLREYTFNSADFLSVYQPESLALYGEYEWSINALSLSLGGRVEEFKADYSDTSVYTENLSDSLFAAKAAVSYNLNDNLLFGSISRGYKAGGFNPDQAVSQEDRLFDPEYNWNYELGIKGNIEQFDADLALTFFYMKREDAQVSDFSVIPRNDGSGAVEFIDVIGNADTGTNKGIEFQSNWRLSDALTLAANIGYLDATFGNYEKTDGSFVDLQDQAQAPKWTFYLASTLALTDALDFTVEFEGKDEHRFSIGHDERAPFTPVLNAEITYRIDQWLAKLWIKNALDRQVFTRGFGGFSNDPRDGYFPAEPYYQFGQERQLGATITYQF